jgi:hypothetical protein
MVDLNIDVSVRGPLFSAAAAPAVKDITHDVVTELVDEGEKRVVLQLYPGHGLKTGHYRRSIHGDMLSSLHGRIHDSKVVYGPWLEGVSRRNQTTRFRGYAMFRNAKQQIERITGAVMEQHVRRFLGRMR